MARQDDEWLDNPADPYSNYLGPVSPTGAWGYDPDSNSYLHNADGSLGSAAIDSPYMPTLEGFNEPPKKKDDPKPSTIGGMAGYGGPFRPSYNFTDAPGFSGPQFQAPPAFQAPSGEEVLKDPGYQFRLGQGRQALEQSASGKGILRTGGTLRDILGYGQNLASQEYGNVFDRAAQSYGVNYGVSRDVFDRTYQGARDAYAPQFASWQARMAADQRAADAEFSKRWDEYVFGAEQEQERDLARFNGPNNLNGLTG